VINGGKKMSNLKSKDIRNLAKDLVKKERNNPSYKYTVQEIEQSKHPDKKCQLCGQLGCDMKYAGQYIHKPCYRKLKKNTFSLMDSKNLKRR
jgi:hypothetical protein